MQQPTIAQVKKADRVVLFDENAMIGTFEKIRNTEAGYPEEWCETNPATGKVWEPDVEGMSDKSLLKCSDVMELWSGTRLIWKVEGFDPMNPEFDEE